MKRFVIRAWSIFFGLVALGCAGPAAAADCKLGVMADLPVTMEGLRASVPVKINGKDTDLWLDSGAFFSIMPRAKALELALKIGAAPSGLYIAGIGGRASTDLATVKSFGIVGQTLKDMEFLVGGSDVGNGLIGRNILAIADTEFDLANGSVKLIMPHDCDHNQISYWTGGKPVFTAVLDTGGNPRDHQFALTVTINGAQVRAVYDSGAPASLLSRAAAERARIDLKGPGVARLSRIGGFGQHTSNGWVAPVDSIAIGDEKILRTHLDVIDGPITDSRDAPEMLLGADYMLAHHIYIARNQRRIYFTYGGGKPFRTAAPPAAESPMSSAANPSLPADLNRAVAVQNAGAEPETAEDFARRGNARIAQHAFADAIADLTRAIALAPTNAAYYGDRAGAYMVNGERLLGSADIDKALTLDPGDGDLLRQRGFMRLLAKDKPGALADAEAAAKVTPPTSLDAFELSALFGRLGQPARAITLLDPVIASHREDARLGSMLNARCWMRGLANVDLPAAQDDCNKAIRRDGAKPNYLDSRGLIAFRQGKYAAAIADYDAALKLAPRRAWSLYVRGLARIALGQADDGGADKIAAQAILPDIGQQATGYGIK